MTRRTGLMCVAAAALLLAGCSSGTTKKAEEAPKAAPEQAPAPTPVAGTYKVRFTTSKGPVVIEVHPEWAPIGAERFRELVKAGYYDGARFFRVVPNFVVQFGIAATPAMTKKWDKALKDDPVKQTNRTGTLAFATMGPNTRTTQIFINLRSNQRLDEDGFAPFAIVTEGMDIVQSLHSGYGERPDQEKITKQGNSYLTASFPNLDYIRKAEIL